MATALIGTDQAQSLASTIDGATVRMPPMNEDTGIPAATLEARRFLHHNIEASRQLGLPDSPILHLAISNLADRLLALPHHSSLRVEQVHVTALRVASQAALEGLPFEWVEADFLSRLHTAAESDWLAAEAARRTKRTDWLGQAKATIRSNGMDPGPDAWQMATRYGWDQSQV